MPKNKKKASKSSNKHKNKWENGDPDGKNGNDAINEEITTKENLDKLDWLRHCESKQDANGEPLLQLEYQPGDEMMKYLQRFLEESRSSKICSKGLNDFRSYQSRTIQHLKLDNQQPINNA